MLEEPNMMCPFSLLGDWNVNRLFGIQQQKTIGYLGKSLIGKPDPRKLTDASQSSNGNLGEISGYRTYPIAEKVCASQS